MGNRHHRQLPMMMVPVSIPGERDTSSGRRRRVTAPFSSLLFEKEAENSNLFIRNKSTEAL